MAEDISLREALAVMAAGEAQADELGIPFNIAVVDAGNNLKAFARQDGAWLGSIDIAQGKAFTARAFDMPTSAIAPLAQPGEPLFGIHASNHGQVVIFPGGIPLMRGEEIVGAVGVSGGTPDQDQKVAEAAAASFS